MLAIAIPVLLVGLYFMTWGFRALVVLAIGLCAFALNWSQMDKLKHGIGMSMAIVLAPFYTFGAGGDFTIMRWLSSSPESYREKRNAIFKFLARWGTFTRNHYRNQNIP